ncbi:hypothetical protein L3Y21_gp093 [Gordonia phage Rabbitrun]|uniref:Uncharacterized protein n=1 Tax=Gordonia phage Rabbitrun TaxID=2762280 RepID=A0A7G8LIV1_9CAUD|nr:hypothetical protein L3Y21_gp093 [Gordonia phage Rabbitrun]QNJ57173.1 hypothetical protein SEA_RABBITRUN_93 [Gordonia phage Rabbitrun]
MGHLQRFCRVRGFESRRSDGRRCVDCGYFTNWICRFKSCRRGVKLPDVCSTIDQVHSRQQPPQMRRLHSYFNWMKRTLCAIQFPGVTSSRSDA